MNKLASEEVKEVLDKGETFPIIGDVIVSEKLLFEGHIEWVVIDTVMRGGKPGITSIDYHPDGYHVSVQQLKKDGTYNPKGFIHKFYMTGNFRGKILPNEIKIERRMKRVFV